MDLCEDSNHPFADVGDLDLSQLEAESAYDVVLFDIALAFVEKARLSEMVEEFLASFPNLASGDFLKVGDKASHRGARLEETASSESVWFVGGPAFVDGLAHMTISLIV